MANDMSFIDSILRSQILEKNISQIDETSEKTKKNISGLIKQLQDIRDSLKNEKLYIQDVGGERRNVTRWRDILDNQTYKLKHRKFDIYYYPIIIFIIFIYYLSIKIWTN